MGLINGIVEFIKKLFEWWFLVMPWEQAIFIKRGNKSKLLGAGLYFKIPFIDMVYVQTTRMRMVDSPMQTISTQDGTSVTLKSAIGYTISDVQLLYNTLYHPEMTLINMSMGHIADFVRGGDISKITPAEIQAYAMSKIKADSYGLTGLNIKITTFAIVKTYRLIQDGSYLGEGLNMDPKK